MTISLHLPRPDDDDSDFTELQPLPLDLGRFLDAIERTPLLEHGFGLHDIHKVEHAWEFLDSECAAHGYIVDLVDARRVLLEVQTQDDGPGNLTIGFLAPGALPHRRREDEELAPWYDAHHITLHVTELKLLPADID